jgi:hypothetical protein
MVHQQSFTRRFRQQELKKNKDSIKERGSTYTCPEVITASPMKTAQKNKA